MSYGSPLEVMRRWQVGVSASVNPEASGLGVLEGMSLGVPQVATDHGGPREVLGQAGLLVPPRDAAQLAHAIARLLDDEAIAWALRSPTGLGSDDVLTIHPMTEASDLPPEMVKIITDAAPTWSAAWRKPR